MATHGRIALGPEFDGLADDVVVPSGSLYHTNTVISAYSVLQSYRRRRALPWLIGWRMNVLFPPEVGRSDATVADIFVHTTLGWGDYPALSIADDGPPALIIETASAELPLRHDPRVGILGGKAAAYAASGVAEYLVFDPMKDYSPVPLTAWRLDSGGRYRAWESGADGRWLSALGIAFAPEGRHLRVFDDAGRPIPSYEELADLIDQQEQQLLALSRVEAELDRQRAEVEEELRSLTNGD